MAWEKDWQTCSYVVKPLVLPFSCTFLHTLTMDPGSPEQLIYGGLWCTPYRSARISHVFGHVVAGDPACDSPVL
jgi:hypothetical protein